MQGQKSWIPIIRFVYYFPIDKRKSPTVERHQSQKKVYEKIRFGPRSRAKQPGNSRLWIIWICFLASTSALIFSGRGDPASTAPAFFNAISFVELVIVGPKSIPLAAPARFNSRWSMPSNFTCNRQSIFYMSSGLLATGRPLLTTPAALN
jgi:hypothetical protein